MIFRVAGCFHQYAILWLRRAFVMEITFLCIWTVRVERSSSTCPDKVCSGRWYFSWIRVGLFLLSESNASLRECFGELLVVRMMVKEFCGSYLLRSQWKWNMVPWHGRGPVHSKGTERGTWILGSLSSSDYFTSSGPPGSLLWILTKQFPWHEQRVHLPYYCRIGIL